MSKTVRSPDWLQTKIDMLQGKREHLESTLRKEKKILSEDKVRLQNIEKAQAFIQKIAKETQSKIRFHIEDIVQLALDTCFLNKYEFIIDFVVERNKTVAKILFKEHGKEIDPMNSSGGGVVDIASFALRLAAWSLSKTRPIIILDEPFKFLSRDLHIRAGEIMRQLSDKLKLQIIMVTHNPSMVEVSNRIFEVKLKNEGGYKVSRVQRSFDKLPEK